MSAEGAREGSGRLHVQEVSDQIQRVNRHFFAGAATSCLVSFAKDQALPLLFLAAGISIVLGVGIPTIAVYVLLASLVAPALTRLGIEPIAVHLFVLYLGMMSMITPPLAIAAFAAATLSGVGPMRTAVAALRFGGPAFVLPFAFAYNPSLLLSGGVALPFISVGLTGGGVLLVTVALAGWFRSALSRVQRLGAVRD